MVNELRGETGLILNGVNYVMRPSFEILAAIETQIGKSLFTLLSQFAEKGITLNEQIAIIKIGASTVPTGEKINLNDKEIGEMIIKNSISSVINSICKFVQKGLGF